MDGFSYNNIFETKGLEYLIIIAFLAMIIPFWIVINRQTGVTGKSRKTHGILSSGILKIPLGIFYGKNHTWTHLEKSGIAKVGLDDLLLHLTGTVKISNMKSPGEIIKKGDLLAEIDQNGKILKIHSPVSGTIAGTNTMLEENPGMLNDDPYGKGWIYMIKPSEWVAETNSCFLAEEAVAWSKKELERFRDFFATSVQKYSPETSMIILQDGGELRDQPLSELPDEVWQDFQKSFLN
jgi:glycine cleavage system H protein